VFECRAIKIEADDPNVWILLQSLPQAATYQSTEAAEHDGYERGAFIM
jgi:hypothetical protein